MANVGRKIGVCIRSLLQNKDISPQCFADQLGYSLKDVWNIIEGKVIVAPTDFERISDVLGIDKMKLLSFDSDEIVPELQYMKEFGNSENLDKILDLMDEYVECIEAM